MFRKLFYVMAVISMVSLFSFAAQAQDVQIQRGAGAACRQATEIRVDQARLTSPQFIGSAVAASWKVVRKSPSCPIRQLRVAVVLQTVKTQHAEAETLRMEKFVTPGVESTLFKIPGPKIVIFTASDARLKITTTVTPIF